MDSFTFIYWLKENYSFQALRKEDNIICTIFQFESYPTFSCLKHSSIVEIYSTFEDDNKFYLVTAENESISLNFFLQNLIFFSEKQILQIFLQISSCLLEFHDFNLSYDHLHPANIIFSSYSKVYLTFFESESKYFNFSHPPS